MRAVLVTNTGDRVHAAELAARPDLKVTFVTEARFVDMYPPGTDIVVVENLNDPSGTARSVLKQRTCDQYAAVVSLSERAAPAGAYLRDYLGLVGPSFDTVANCTIKFAMKRRFTAAGLPTATYALANSPSTVGEAATKVGWPIIVKPVIGAGTDATMVFASEDALESSAAREYFGRLCDPATTSEKAFPVIVERYLEVIEELHCDGYVQEGRVVFARASRYLRPVLDYASGLFGSYLLAHEDPVNAVVLEMHARAVRAVGIVDGVTHFEAFQTPEGLFAGEIACRPGGGGIRRMIQLQSGLDVWSAHIAASLGEKYVWKYPGEPSTGQIAQLMLPTRRGIVRTISSAAEFANVPGLIEVQMKLQPGDIVDGLLDSSAISGLVFAWVDGPQGLDAVVTAVREAFPIEVDELLPGSSGAPDSTDRR